MSLTPETTAPTPEPVRESTWIVLGRCLLIFLGACGAIAILAYGCVGIASARTGGVAMVQIVFGFLLGVPFAALVLLGFAVAGQLNGKTATYIVAAFTVVFLAMALAHTRYGTEQKLKADGLEVRVEREYGDPFDYFVIRWRTPGGRWSERERVGDDLVHKPPFTLQSLKDGRYRISDRTGTMQTEIGPGVRNRKPR